MGESFKDRIKLRKRMKRKQVQPEIDLNRVQLSTGVRELGKAPVGTLCSPTSHSASSLPGRVNSERPSLPWNPFPSAHVRGRSTRLPWPPITSPRARNACPKKSCAKIGSQPDVGGWGTECQPSPPGDAAALDQDNSEVQVTEGHCQSPTCFLLLDELPIKFLPSAGSRR